MKKSQMHYVGRVAHISKGAFKVVAWLGSGWFFFFLIGASVFYFQQMHKKEKLCQSLLEKREFLENEKAFVLREQKELELRLNNHSDHEWIEMVLMKKLGMVPEGQTKVYFKKEILPPDGG